MPRLATKNRPGEGGQMALVDALVFLVLMGLASGMVWSGTGYAGDEIARQGMQQYASDLAGTLMEFQVCDLRYISPDGQVVDMTGQPVPVSRALLDRMSMHDAQCDFREYDDAIIGAARAIARPGMGLALHCMLETGEELLISDTVNDTGQMPGDRYASSFTYMLPGDAGQGVRMTVTVYVWVL